MTRNKQLIILYIFLLSGIITTSLAIEQTSSLGKKQYDKQVKRLSKQYNDEKIKYRSVGRDIISLFPKETRKSPFYLSIRYEFLEYRRIMKTVDEKKTTLEEDHKKYKSQFSHGIFKSVETLEKGDDNWEEAFKLSESLKGSIPFLTENLNKLTPLNQLLVDFLQKMEEVKYFYKELEFTIEQSSKKLGEFSGKAEDLKSELNIEFQDISAYEAYKRGEQIQMDLDESIQLFSSTIDSIKVEKKNLDYLLTGRVKSGDEKMVWNLYQSVVENYNSHIKSLISLTAEISELQSKCETSIEFLSEFSRVLKGFNQDIVDLERRIEESHKQLVSETTSTRFASYLVPLVVDGVESESPYMSLLPAFNRVDQLLIGMNDSLEKVKSIRKEFVDHAGTMDGLRTDDEKYQRFSDIQDEFNKGKKKTQDRLNEFREELDRFWEFFNTYKKALEGLDGDIVDMETRIDESHQRLMSDSSRFAIYLVPVVVDSVEEESPYRSLLPAFNRVGKLLFGVNVALEEVRSIRNEFVDHVGTMDGLRTDDEKFQRFNDIQDEFSEGKKRTLGKIEEFQEELDRFWEFFNQFKQELEEIDADIVNVERRVDESHQQLITDSTRFASYLVPVVVDSVIEESPYRSLLPAFNRVGKLLFGVNVALEEVRSIRNEFVDHVGTMDGLRTDDEKFQRFNDIQDEFSEGKKRTLGKIEEFQEELDRFWEFYDKYKDALENMDRGLSELNTRHIESVAVFELDRNRLIALYENAPERADTNIFPYSDLKSAFLISEEILSDAENISRKANNYKSRLIAHVNAMDGLKTDEKKYNTFKDIQNEFDRTKMEALDEYKHHLESSEEFKNVILDHFLNTQQYWDIEYVVESEKTLWGNEMVEENYGYIYDPNEYPEKPYHGKLISQFQLKLKIERARGREMWTPALIFSGENDFPIQGMRLTSGDSVLYEIFSEGVQIKEEKDKDDVFVFKWELPINFDLVKKLVESDKLIFKIHFLTVTHRIGLTLYKQKMSKEYVIPEERIVKWKAMVG
ncbi:MAG: hypothetical protein H8E82_01455 [Candidatus Marinimicrobia bacterium]|nr:hypothetical protein [Candidatus Neomarinimicrobiota bacterium]